MKPYSSGQTIIEVVVVVSIVVIVVTGLVSATVNSLRVSRYTNEKSQATKLASEGIEMIRRDRDTSWNTFYQRAPQQWWCLSNTGIWTARSGSCQPNIQNKFIREVELVWLPNNLNPNLSKMEVTVTVYWNEGSQQHKSQIQTYFTQWK